MTLSAAHWHSRAEEARAAAKLCDDPILRQMIEDIARGYDELAASRSRVTHSLAALAQAEAAARRSEAA
jgi:O-methyltransferase involved in polyketide biosynthesis